MDFKQALGFLGLIAVAMLVLIYLLKPNYQQKVISSTFLWKLSLKYRRKKIPINRIRQLLLFICQILLLTTAAVILTKPHLINTAELPKNEKIIVIDGSASMRAIHQDQSRFDRAIAQARVYGKDIIDDGGMVSVIIADEVAKYALTDSNEPATRLVDLNLFDQALDNLSCSYGNADINGAMRIAEDILLKNHTAKTVLYTATTYQGVDENAVTIVDVSLKDDKGNRIERNAAILNAEADFVEGYFEFTIEIVNYNNENGVKLTVSVEDARFNIEGSDGSIRSSTATLAIKNERLIFCTPGEPTIVKFRDFQVQDDKFPYDTDDEDVIKIFSYTSVNLNITVEDDTFREDDDFCIYGGNVETIKVLYVSTKPCDFIRGMLNVLLDRLDSKWRIEVHAYNFEDLSTFVGYDLYVFEHQVPSVLPKDGASLIIDPNQAPTDIGFTLDPTPAAIDKYFFAAGETNIAPDSKKILHGINPSNIMASSYKRILYADDSYQQLMGIRSGDSIDPVFLVKKTDSVRVALFSFDIHLTDLAVLPDFPLLLINLFNYFIPTTINKTQGDIDIPCKVFDVDEQISLNTRGTSIQVSGKNEFQKTISTFPNTIKISTPGTYTVDQILLNPTKKSTERFFVKINSEQSNFNRLDTFAAPIIPDERPGLDLILYIASALVALFFIERILYIREEL